jgi:hypothetical protein
MSGAMDCSDKLVAFEEISRTEQILLIPNEFGQNQLEKHPFAGRLHVFQRRITRDTSFPFALANPPAITFVQCLNV